ncbi:uncharacterized protein ACA1_006210 [Acanthamoeba castellanii str. Neff]|jgi:uncharacterized membrane protein YhaH (DUF805 family)|uniref:MARVEL domain-containing protein n=1 Tax=Acanthamoeba castellanii (strain ATCC 30010 / Neff) TaxID=1257118 RepID=L8HGZ1_ACACF|nr:uncharacterized protein ACA1_006210 [Acanthamoeba castellanii str. Neff]ELR24487.1 hypothetical protein ACA1_006210 [Acanthamoeba castellanii str. Neff]
MSSAGKIVVGVGVIVGAAFALVCILNIGLYGGAMDLEGGYCQGPTRERVGAMGIVAGLLGFIISLVTIAALLLPLFSAAAAEPMASLLVKLLLLICIFIVILFYLAAWALMAKDIHDFNRYANCDHPPHVWSAALAFGLFGNILAILLFAVVAVALVVDRSASDANRGGSRSKSSGGDNPAQTEYS